MEVEVAKSAGFCFGVKRAVSCVYDEIRSGPGPIYTYGPIIHNEQVTADLSSKGIRIIESLDELDAVREGTVIIRSHGVSKAELERIKGSGLRVVDATCPFVKRIHRIVEDASAEGRDVIIVGNPDHPEVRAIKGWCSGRCFVIKNTAESEQLPVLGKVTVVSQTTFNHINFQEIVDKLVKMDYDMNVVNTICNATQERQSEAVDIARRVETMIVIGGKHSSNTQKLYELCKHECSHTYYVQTLDDLTSQWFPHVSSVGITAGASTPNKIIEEVHTYVRSI
jgi:4-hydroxy-3-methylbut-2-enyl diphosphate reductase